MIDLKQLESNQEIERKVRSSFQMQDPDPSFIERLQKELAAQFTNQAVAAQDQNTLNNHTQWIGRIKPVLSPLGWGLIGFILILSLIWGINTLIPRNVPGGITKPSPSPSISPSPQPAIITAPPLENAVFYTVEAGDTLASIEEKTGVPIETIHDLNVFVFQANNLTAGLKLLIGFTGKVPMFYTVQERDTIEKICDKAGISVEDFNTLNRLGMMAPDSQNSLSVPQYKLTPGIRVIIGLENLDITKNDNIDGHLIILSEVDLNCDYLAERILGVEAPEIEYFNLAPQLSAIILERSDGSGHEKVWQQTSQEASVSYLAYQLFRAEGCNKFLVVIGHKGKESVNVYRWDGKTMTNVLKLSGRFLFEGDWMKDVFGDYQKSANTLILGELQQPTSSGKNVWILRGYQWIDGKFQLTIETRVESRAGG
jgi:hypothetical protein